MQKLIDAYELERAMYRKCIDTDEEIEKGRAKWDSGLWIRYKVFEDAITLAPTVDAEPVVRCDDCIYRDGKTPGQPNILCWQMHVDDFCSYGTRMDERREEEPEINPCRGCEDYDGKGGCLSHGGCGERRKYETD